MATTSVRSPAPARARNPAPALPGGSVRGGLLPPGLRRLVLHIAILTLVLLVSVLVAGALNLTGSDLGPPLAPGDGVVVGGAAGVGGLPG